MTQNDPLEFGEGGLVRCHFLFDLQQPLGVSHLPATRITLKENVSLWLPEVDSGSSVDVTIVFE